LNVLQCGGHSFDDRDECVVASLRCKHSRKGLRLLTFLLRVTFLLWIGTMAETQGDLCNDDGDDVV
jgi:hypothetical protein